MNSLSETFGKKVELLHDKLFEGVPDSFGNIASVCGKYAVFLSVSDIHEQAYIFRASANTAEDAWKAACAKALEFINSESFSPVWIKADITANGKKRPLADILSALKKGYAKFYRKGIAFDEQFDIALIETELNVYSLIDYENGQIDIKTLNKYLAANDIKTLTQFPEDVIAFECKSAFCDEKNEVCALYSDRRNCGRRVSGKFDKDMAYRVITTSAEYLAMQIGLDGQFDYGVYPAVPKAIPGYNILRHTTSIWSMLCTYRISGNKFLLEQAENAIGYMIRNMSYKYPDRDGKENVLYLFEETRNEVKLGANGVAIIVLTEYMDLLNTDKYVKIVKELALGILELFDERNGSFFHVLKYPTLAPRDKFRTVYYDGEAVFALSRAYSVTKDRRFLDTAMRAVDRFIEKNYEQYADHWVAYSVNEITKHMPLEKYLNFGIKNVQSNLKKIHDQPTTYHTYLELLCVSFELAERIERERLRCSAVEDFDIRALAETIFHRADHMLNGYGFPEYVMYFANPANTLGAFFIRHDAYRIRIDDVQHFCCAYYALYRNYEKLDALRQG